MTIKMDIKIPAILILLSLLAVPAFGISVGYSVGDNSGSVSSSNNYRLDTSTSLKSQAILGSGRLYQETQASGEGDNEIIQHVASNSYSINGNLDSVGSLSTSSTISASTDAASVSQAASGSGSMDTGIYGKTMLGDSYQAAGVIDGSISTNQNVMAAQGVAAIQNTAISGKAGNIKATSGSAQNDIAVVGNFLGESNLNAELCSGATNKAFITGSASIADISALDENDMNYVSSDDTMVSVNGLYAQQDADKLGDFSFQAMNMRKSSGDSGSSVNSLLTGPLQGLKGSPSSYRLANWRWNQATPKIQMYVKNDGYLQGRGLDAKLVVNAVNSAEKTWDDATNKNLFNNGNTAEGDTSGTGYTSKSADTYDGANVMAFKPITGSALAYSRTYYNYNQVGGFYSALESDLVFNSNDRWSTFAPTSFTSTGPFDVQSVVLHELGHTIGLLDLYNLPSTDPRRSDYSQIMNAYNDPQRTLGAGDANGVWKLYH